MEGYEGVLGSDRELNEWGRWAVEFIHMPKVFREYECGVLGPLGNRYECVRGQGDENERKAGV